MDAAVTEPGWRDSGVDRRTEVKRQQGSGERGNVPRKIPAVDAAFGARHACMLNKSKTSS